MQHSFVPSSFLTEPRFGSYLPLYLMVHDPQWKLKQPHSKGGLPWLKLAFHFLVILIALWVVLWSSSPTKGDLRILALWIPGQEALSRFFLWRYTRCMDVSPRTVAAILLPAWRPSWNVKQEGCGEGHGIHSARCWLHLQMFPISSSTRVGVFVLFFLFCGKHEKW